MKRLEQDIHKTIRQGLQILLPRDWRIVHAPNGGKRGVVEGRHLKEMGMSAGFPDLMILGYCEQREVATAWFLEVKAPKGRIGPEQRDWHDSLRDLGFGIEVVKSFEDALEVCRGWGLPLKNVWP
jgi:hypothetical protein